MAREGPRDNVSAALLSLLATAGEYLKNETPLKNTLTKTSKHLKTHHVGHSSTHLKKNPAPRRQRQEDLFEFQDSQGYIIPALR